MNRWILTIPALALSVQVLAQNIEVTGSIPVVVSNNTVVTRQGEKMSKPDIVLLQKIHLSDSAKLNLADRIKSNKSQGLIRAARTQAASLPEQVELGMNNTPVLNQGAHGSCVTFAITGAIDAVIGEGDYISQLCSLELGDYLVQNHLIEYSGWDGSFGPMVLNELDQYGIISKQFQTSNGCAGVKDYPIYDPSNLGKPMSVDEYTSSSRPMSDFASWKIILDINDAFSDRSNPERTLAQAKQALHEGHRLTFGVLLDVEQAPVGALGSYHSKYDSWVLTSEIENDAINGVIDAGHQMIITGYDDNAVVKDIFGHESKGLLTLRNSWGSRAGDGGNYYMSYDYFKMLADEVQLIKDSQSVKG